jgi:hypothetical protein
MRNLRGRYASRGNRLAYIANKVGLEADGQNFLLMHAMGPNVAGVIGSAIAAGQPPPPVLMSGFPDSMLWLHSSPSPYEKSPRPVCCPENRTSTREAVVDAMLASGDELAQLQPALNLLSPDASMASTTASRVDVRFSGQHAMASFITVSL